MSKLASIWSQWSTQQKAILAGVLLATFAGFGTLMSAVSTPPMAMLYGGLDSSTAGDVLNALEAMDIRAEVRGDTIYVPETKRDSVRMALAQQGLPQQGQPGFELLEEINGFATTAEMFDAAYWRAKEGELARTILTTPGVKLARVHLAVPKTSSFSRQRRTPTASVTVTMKRGRLDLRQATSMRYLIALAVSDLEPEQVAVLDSTYGVVLRPGAAKAMAAFTGDEDERARTMEQNLLDMLEARVGPGNARVTVALEFDREHETVSERILDPNSRVMMGRETTDVQQSDSGGSGAVTVASNLPEGDAGSGQSSSSSQRSETNETTRFDISEVKRQREKLPGGISRVHVAVLINEPAPEGEEGVVEPRPVQELESIGELVRASIGFNESRGDLVTVKSMPFHEIATDGPFVEPSGIMDYLKNNLVAIMQVLIPAIVVLALALFVLRPVLMQSPSEAAPIAAAAPTQALPEIPINTAQIGQTKTPVEELRQLASADQEAATSVLKSWLGDIEEAA